MDDRIAGGDQQVQRLEEGALTAGRTGAPPAEADGVLTAGRTGAPPAEAGVARRAAEEEDQTDAAWQPPMLPHG